ncbi:MAG: glycosyltransferase family 2 protein [Rhodospirillaceae bacterium]|nr:glycosyltransferase family 2 protein [Rhodospirillaceae bacterium]
MRLFRSLAAYFAILHSGSFDRRFYRVCYPDSGTGRVNSLWHFLTVGWREGRWPNSSFDMTRFLTERPALRAQSGFPLALFLAEHAQLNDERAKRQPAIDPLAAGTHDLNDLPIRLKMLSDAERRALLRHLLAYELLSSDPQAGSTSLTDIASDQAIDRIAQRSRPQTRNRPDVSIVIPIYGQERLALSCIESILLWDYQHCFEIVVADDASPTGFPMKLYGLPGVTLFRNETNQGYLHTCNRAAAVARGRYLIFLNSDTIVLPNWLDALIDTLEAVPGVGMAGSRLLFADGRLQEAGATVREDGTILNYGRSGNAEDPAFTVQREVDYCSGAAIALRKALWDSLGGFDTRYAPAYYEDTDLAFRIRERGERVLYQPLSTVIHFEGQSSQSHPDGSVKPRYLETNRQRFLARWRNAIENHEHESAGSGPSDLRDRRVRPSSDRESQ